MTERRPAKLRDQELEQTLVEIAALVDYPPTPDLASRAPAALPAPAAFRLRWRPLRHGLLAATLALLLVAGAALAVGLGLRGLGIVLVESPRPAAADLQLGERVALSEAQARVPYRILVPAGELGDPDEVYLDERLGIEQVTLVYRSNGDVQLLITQFQATPAADVATKEVGPGTTVEPVTVAGAEGLWIEGEPHVLLYRDASGAVIEDRVRLVGDVLIWRQGELTLRLEGVSSLEEAVALAASVE